MRVAAVDCGTNTLRLLVVDIDTSARVAVPLVRRSEIVRLGQDVDTTGEFATEALERTFATLDDYGRVIEAHGVDVSARRMVATSAVRDVSNRDVFVEGARDRLGVTPDIISGENEGFLMYDGVAHALAARADIAEPVLVLDIGGGSTELVAADQHTGRLRAVSLDVGSVRLTERHLHGDPPTPAEVDALTRDVRAALDTVELPIRRAQSLVGVAGTVLTVAAMALGLETYDKPRLHLVRLPRADVETVVERLLAMTLAERRALAFMAPGRADVIPAGGLILREVVRHFAVPDVFPSVQDILDGIAWSVAFRHA